MCQHKLCSVVEHMANIVHNLISSKRQIADVTKSKLKHKIRCKEDKAGSRNNAGPLVRKKNCIKRFNCSTGKEEGVNCNRQEKSFQIEERRKLVACKKYNGHYDCKCKIFKRKRLEFLKGENIKNLNYKEN